MTGVCLGIVQLCWSGGDYGPSKKGLKLVGVRNETSNLGQWARNVPEKTFKLVAKTVRVHSAKKEQHKQQKKGSKATPIPSKEPNVRVIRRIKRIMQELPVWNDAVADLFFFFCDTSSNDSRVGS